MSDAPAMFGSGVTWDKNPVVLGSCIVHIAVITPSLFLLLLFWVCMCSLCLCFVTLSSLWHVANKRYVDDVPVSHDVCIWVCDYLFLYLFSSAENLQRQHEAFERDLEAVQVRSAVHWCVCVCVWGGGGSSHLLPVPCSPPHTHTHISTCE